MLNLCIPYCHQFGTWWCMKICVTINFCIYSVLLTNNYNCYVFIYLFSPSPHKYNKHHIHQMIPCTIIIISVYSTDACFLGQCYNIYLQWYCWDTLLSFHFLSAGLLGIYSWQCMYTLYKRCGCNHGILTHNTF